MGRRIRERRQALGMSQSRLALLSGIGQSTISALESGESRTARTATLHALAISLIEDPVYLRTGDRPLLDVFGPCRQADGFRNTWTPEVSAPSAMTELDSVVADSKRTWIAVGVVIAAALIALFLSRAAS